MINILIQSEHSFNLLTNAVMEFPYNISMFLILRHRNGRTHIYICMKYTFIFNTDEHKIWGIRGINPLRMKKGNKDMPLQWENMYDVLDMK